MQVGLEERRLFSAIAGAMIGVGIMISYVALSPILLLYKASEIRVVLQEVGRHSRGSASLDDFYKSIRVSLTEPCPSRFYDPEASRQQPKKHYATLKLQEDLP